ncbi:MAG: carboxylesterase family protein, partial [Candidatus Acidiferrales bacterium]
MPQDAKIICFATLIMFALAILHGPGAQDEVRTESGIVSGTLNSDGTVRMFKGIPFAAPPIGDLRWKPPHPPLAWQGIRPADKFGPACMQTDVYGDIHFRDVQPSEDCLNLTIWLPAHPVEARLPV